MTDRSWLFNGVANGAAFTNANTLATDGTPTLLVQPGSGGSIVADNTIPWLGLMGMKIVCPGGAITSVARFPTGSTGTTGRVRFYRYCAAYPSTNMQFAMFYNAADTLLFRFGINTTGKLFIGGTTGTGTITEGQVMRYEVVWDQGTSATTGTWTINAYVGQGTTVVATVSASAANLGFATPATKMDLGTGVSVAITQTFFVPRIVDSGGAELGPYIPPVVGGGWQLGSIAF